MSNPHADDFCVVCKQGVERGITMYPVVGIENGCVCEACKDNASKHFVGRP